MFLDLIVLCVALFLIGWFLIHRFRVRQVEPNGNITAFSTLKALMIFFLLAFAVGGLRLGLVRSSGSVWELLSRASLTNRG